MEIALRDIVFFLAAHARIDTAVQGEVCPAYSIVIINTGGETDRWLGMHNPGGGRWTDRLLQGKILLARPSDLQKVWAAWQ